MMLALRLASWTVFFTGLALWLWAKRAPSFPLPEWAGAAIALAGIGMSLLATILGRDRRPPTE